MRYITLFLISFAFAEDSLNISKIYVQPKGVFADAVVNTPYEAKAYQLLENFHATTKESVVRARIPFNEGDTVSHTEIQEAERNLRALQYISNAKIEAKKDSAGGTDLYIETSDNWTFAPAVYIGKPGEEWLWSVGLLENNLLGYGHTIGFFFSHEEVRDQKYLLFNTADFFIPYHKFGFIISENSDGFERSLSLGYPFISRAKNQWSYSADALWSKRDENYYKGLEENLLSFWLLRSFGGTSFKTYLGMGYDYNKLESGEWRMENDSRIGISYAASRVKLQKRYNLHRVKWVEDVEQGYYIKTTVAKNFKEINAINDDWFFEHIVNLSAGTRKHNFLAKGRNSFYYNENDFRDMHSILFGEYIFKPALAWSSVLDARIESWQKTSYKRQLYLDGNSIFPGFPLYYLAGENTFAFKAEQRYFPSVEMFTLVPAIAAFLVAGEATDNLRDFEPRDLLYEAGIGLRVSNSKSVQGVVHHVNLSWPLNGELKEKMPRFSFVGKFEF